MKIAVTYENGQVFGHFGRTEAFKVYDVENQNIISSQIISSNGEGHGALAGVLASHDIDILICGGIGPGAVNALEGAGIEVCAGASGDADEAVAAFLKGELVSTGSNCNHHHHDDHQACGAHGCGHHGCGDHGIEGPNVGKTVSVHYVGTLDDGTQFDSSYDREPLEFLCGAGMMIRGFDKAVANMSLGQIVDVHLMPEEAYGFSNPRNIFDVEIARLPGSENLLAGQKVYLTNTMGQPFVALVTKKTDTIITFDANHELAGKELNFKIELLSIKD